MDAFLSPDQRAGLAAAKARAVARQEAEAEIPEHLLYVKGWPTGVPTAKEAKLLAAVRYAVADVVGLPKTFINPDQIVARYRELLAIKAAKTR